MLRECVLLVLVCVLEAGSLSGRGFFCRDPDTGKLHAVNTTWPSSSFCGNYHCKLRRKNLTETEYAPMRQLNVTNVKLYALNLTEQNDRTQTEAKNLQNNPSNTEIKADIDAKHDTTIEELFPIERNVASKIDDKKYELYNETDRDRYLTDTEIRTISEILHTVKKSDLDAIVEIYNLAQEIYKEIDKTSTDQVLNNAFYSTKNAKQYKTNVIRTEKKDNRASYWYEPLSSNKIRPAEVVRTDIARNDVIAPMPHIVRDLDEQASILKKQYTTTIRPTTLPPAPPAPPAPPIVHPPTGYKPRPVSDTYFNGPLTHKDFGKLPYYYPMSSFQRLSSYRYPQKSNNVPLYPISSAASNKIPLPPKPVLKPVTYRPQAYSESKYQYPKEIKPSILLPYPFSFIHHYNWSYPNAFHSDSALDQFEFRKKEKPVDKPIKNNYENAKAVLMNPYLENFQDLEVKAMRKEDKLPIRPLVQKVKEEKRRPEWQTDPLPNHILEEVRARIQDKQRLKPFPLKKKVKLERVGKLLKVEDRSRVKRSPKEDVEDKVLEPELYEVYIERTTCNSDYSVPGYFRYGNLSQPYPDCCPQRIS